MNIYNTECLFHTFITFPLFVVEKNETKNVLIVAKQL